MRPIVTPLIIVAITIFAAACSGDVVTAPTSGTSIAATGSPLGARGATQLPFRGSYTGLDTAVVVPPSLLGSGTAEGTAAHLGRYTATLTFVADLATPTATGTYTFTAANGDQMVATFIGEGVDLAPGVFSATDVFTIVSGTGRFSAATGTFTLRRIAIIDFATGTSTSSGSFEGEINLNK